MRSGQGGVGRSGEGRTSLAGPEVLRALQEHFGAVAQREHVPGVVYALVGDQAIVQAGGVGELRAGGRERPGPDAASRLCSMTKSFVAAALLQLRDEGRLALDDPVARHVPELDSLELPTTDSPQITLRSLLTMAGGLPADDKWGDRQMDRDPAWVDSLFRAGATFAHPPGTAFEYSNLGWVMLGRVVTNVAGAPVQEVVTKRLLEPLGLHATCWSRPVLGPVMTGHRWCSGSWREETRPLDDGDFASMGGLWSTAADVAHWMLFLLDAFPPRDDPDEGPLRRASRREMQQVQRAWPSAYDAGSGRLNAGGYGYGLMVYHDLRFGHMVGHPGGLPGFGSFMRWLPDRGVGVVALGNVTYAEMEPATLEALELLDDLGALPPKPRIAATAALGRACDGLARLLDEWDDGLADTLFAENVFADEDRDVRRRRAARLRSDHGPLAPGELVASSATAGRFDLHGPRGGVRVSLTLTPEVPPRVQTYEIEPLAEGESGERSGAA
jgi:CubicO group peptidase (beta-lactamase class C family)